MNRKNEIIIIDKLVPGGSGLGRTGGKVLMVPGVLPGEEVEVKIIKETSHFLLGQATCILKPSPRRRVPPCPHYATCGGCDWMHIEDGEQIRQKENLLREAFRRNASMDLPPVEVTAGPFFACRNRVQFQRDERGRVGFMRAESHEVTSLRACPILVPSLERLLLDLGAEDSRMRAPGRQEDGRIHAFGTGRWAVHNLRGSPPDLAVEVSGARFQFAVDNFFQSNLALLPVLLNFALEGAGGGMALDLYCGVGVFSRFLESRFERVVAAEIDAGAFHHAQMNLTAGKTTLRHQAVEDFPKGGEQPDLLVVDPPRLGLSPRAGAVVLGLRPKRLVYVSCNPATLARDAKAILKSGYGLESIRGFDFYPQTSHLEVVARFDHL